MEAIAKTKYLKGSPRKARLVIDLIRGRNVSQALSILKFTDKRAADPIAKTLQSAIANATYLAEQQNIAIDPDDLWINLCYVDMGPTKNRRRMRPAPQGRAYREQRHYCHITIKVTSDTTARDEAAAKYAEAKAKRDAARNGDGGKKTKGPGGEAAKADAPKPAKKAKGDKTEATDVTAAGVIETPVAAETVNTPTEVATENTAADDASVADAKNVQSQTPAEANDSKPADEAQQDRNEELERQ